MPIFHKCDVCGSSYLIYNNLAEVTVKAPAPPEFVEGIFMFCGECRRLYDARKNTFNQLKEEMETRFRVQYRQAIIDEIDRDRQGMIKKRLDGASV